MQLIGEPEVWYEMEVSLKSADDWSNGGTTNNADSVIGIEKNIALNNRLFGAVFDFRAVRVTVIREILCS